MSAVEHRERFYLLHDRRREAGDLFENWCKKHPDAAIILTVLEIERRLDSGSQNDVGWQINQAIQVREDLGLPTRLAPLVYVSPEQLAGEKLSDQERQLVQTLHTGYLLQATSLSTYS